MNNSEMLNIPPHWKTVKLGEFVEKQKGKKPTNLSLSKSESFYLPYVDIKAFEEGIIEKYTDGVGVVFCEDDDFIIVWDGSRSGLAGKAIKGALGSTLLRVSFPDNVLKNYAFYFLKSKYIEINSRAKGSGTPHVDPDLLWNYVFPLPPLPEQHLIVAKIEELFSELDNAVENLKKAKEQLKVYRQAVLKWAFEGKLTEEWRKERESQNTEYQSEKEEVRMAAEEIIKYSSNNELPVGWKWFKLAELTEVKDGTHDTPKYVSDGIPFITQKNIREEGLTFSNVQYITQKDHDKFFRRSNVTFNDILISMIGANRGMSCIVNDNRTFSIKNVGLIKSNTNNFDQLYLLYFLKSSYSRNYVKSLSKGGAQEFVGLTELRNFPILKCPILEQYQIVQEIETRFSVADKLELSIDQSLQQAEALRQSILNKAFEGRLASTNALPSSEGSGVGH